MAENCFFCEKIERDIQNDPLLIHEFAHSYWLFGKDQYYPGYSVLILKQHVREVHHLAPDIQAGLWPELMQACAAIEKIFKPLKLNLASYGNLVPHVHFHIFPRYLAEPEKTRLGCPFANSDEFEKFPADISCLAPKRALLQAEIVAPQIHGDRKKQ